MVPVGFNTRRQALSQPRGEFVVGRKARELVPVVGDRIDRELSGRFKSLASWRL